jgi:hypothetical protein
LTLSASRSFVLLQDVRIITTDIPQVAATYRVINLNYSIYGALKQINAM